MYKTLIAIFCFCAFNSALKAQATFDTCLYVYQFNGEWMYANGSDTIRVYLRVHRDFHTEINSIEDVIYGWHEYKQGNTIIESVYENRFMPIDVDTMTKRSFSIGLKSYGPHCLPTLISASGGITDYLQASQTKIVTVKLNATGTIMTWKQEHSAGYGLFGRPSGMTLPREFILVKQ